MDRNEILFICFKEDVMEVMNPVQIKLIELFKRNYEVSDEEYNKFIDYWNERIDKENTELEGDSNG